MGLEVYTALANTGGFTEAELKTVEKKAYALGAKEHVNLDVTEDYYEKCIRYMVFGNVLRNKTYPVSVSSERTFQAWRKRRKTRLHKGDRDHETGSV